MSKEKPDELSWRDALVNDGLPDPSRLRRLQPSHPSCIFMNTWGKNFETEGLWLMVWLSVLAPKGGLSLQHHSWKLCCVQVPRPQGFHDGRLILMQNRIIQKHCQYLCSNLSYAFNLRVMILEISLLPRRAIVSTSEGFQSTLQDSVSFRAVRFLGFEF